MDAYLSRVTRNLERLQVAFATIKARSATVDSRQRLEYERQVDLLNAKVELACELLETLKSATDVSEQQESKVRLEGVCVEIENAIDSAWSKLG